MSRRSVFVLVTSVALAGVPARTQVAAERPAYPIADAPRDLQPAVQRADLLIVELQSAVLWELTTNVERPRPAAAVAGCHAYVSSAAYWIARREGVELGRTSVRLRNPANAPRAWAAPFVARYAGRKAADLDGFVVDLGDRVGVLRPIAERSDCASCHGPKDRLDPSVRAEIAERYPSDRAVDFRDGDLRGWFWVEVPRK